MSFLFRLSRYLPLVDETPEGENLTDMLTQGEDMSGGDSDILEVMDDIDKSCKSAATKSKVEVLSYKIFPPELTIPPKMDWF